jgi:S1-C subfamily serine protease
MLGAAGVPRGAVITAVNGKPINGIADFAATLARWPMASAPRCAYHDR